MEIPTGHNSGIRIADLPKVELHLHLEGAIRLQTLRELALRSDKSSPIGDPEWARTAFQYKNLSHFIVIMHSILDACLRTPDDYERIAYELLVDLADQNVRYVEVSFVPARAIRWGISFDEILAALNSAKQRIRYKRPIRVGWIVAFGRESGADIVADLAQRAVRAKKNGVVGIDLHGDEATASPTPFAEAFEIARSGGLGLRAHAGESTGAAAIWDALRHLGVSRIAHGIAAIEDADLINYLRAHAITLDICPTSNLSLGVVPSLSTHPIRQLFDLGVRVTVNSDDPLLFGTTISKEFQVLIRELGFTYEQLRQLTLYAVEGAFLSDQEKAILRYEVERDFATGKDL